MISGFTGAAIAATDGADVLARVLAIVGGLIGLVGLVLSTRREFLDRPRPVARLVLYGDPHDGGAIEEVKLRAVNNGRRSLMVESLQLIYPDGETMGIVLRKRLEADGGGFEHELKTHPEAWRHETTRAWPIRGELEDSRGRRYPIEQMDHWLAQLRS